MSLRDAPTHLDPAPSPNPDGNEPPQSGAELLAELRRLVALLDERIQEASQHPGPGLDEGRSPGRPFSLARRLEEEPTTSARRPEMPNGETSGSPPPLPLSVALDPTAPSVSVNGRHYTVSTAGAAFVKALLDAGGNWVSSTESARWPAELVGSRLDRVCKRLPRPVRKLIESKRGTGYRLK
jgi:hypothetical protein